MWKTLRCSSMHAADAARRERCSSERSGSMYESALADRLRVVVRLAALS